MSTTDTAPAAGTPRSDGPRPAKSRASQTLRLARTEFTLFIRYKTAWLYLVLPLPLVFVMSAQPSAEVLPGVDTPDLAMAGIIGMVGMFLGIGHVSNVFTARRESLVLKRLRASGVPAQAIFGAVLLLVFLFMLLVAAVIAGLVYAVNGTLPSDPVMLLLAVALSCAAMTLLGLLFTLFVRSAEAAQLTAIVPIMVLMFLGGGFLPLDALHDTLRQVVWFLPAAPVTELIQAAYTGFDVFGGVEGAAPLGAVGLWAAGLPSIAVMLAWIVVLGYAVHRFFRWDPRWP